MFPPATTRSLKPRFRRARWLAVALWLAAGAAQAGETYDYFVTGNPAAETPAPTEAGLMLMGGSDDVDEAFRWFIGKAGGGHIVVLRASGGDDYAPYLFKDLGGVASVETLLFHARAASDDPRVLAIIRHADGIFLAGGDQANYVNFWRGTPVNAALDAHVRAGRPIGGTSAGLAILGRYSYGALDGGSLLPDDALRDPLGPAVTLVRDFLHLPHLEHAITDSHFDTRKRIGRLVPFVARLTLEERDPGVFGIGVDEKTALCVEPDGTARVLTGAQGKVWIVFPLAATPTFAANEPLRVSGVRVVSLDPASRIDLKTLAIVQPAGEWRASAAAGRLALERAP